MKIKYIKKGGIRQKCEMKKITHQIKEDIPFFNLTDEKDSRFTKNNNNVIK